VTALFTVPAFGQNYSQNFIGWYDGANKLILVGVSNGNLVVQYWNTPTSFNGPYRAIPFWGAYVWVQLVDDGVSITISASVDGNTYIPMITITRAASFLGALGYVDLCFGVNTNGALYGISNTLLSYSD
jgi:hypothetical protein